MICSNCGSKNYPWDNKCNHCGEYLNTMDKVLVSYHKKENYNNLGGLVFDTPSLNGQPLFKDARNVNPSNSLDLENNIKKTNTHLSKNPNQSKNTRLKRLYRRKKKSLTKKEFFRKYMIIILTILMIIIFMIALGTYVFLQNKKAFLKEIKNFEKINEKVIDDYSNFVQELGSIGNIVYMPDNSRFELRKNEAVIRLSKLENNIKANIEELEQVVTPTKELEEVRDLLIKALIAFQEYDIKELRGFVETLDPNLASKMMSGYLSQTPFKRAVSVSKESSAYIDKAMEIWYNAKNRLL